MREHIYSHSIWQAEAEGLQIQDQPGLHSKYMGRGGEGRGVEGRGEDRSGEEGRGRNETILVQQVKALASKPYPQDMYSRREMTLASLHTQATTHKGKLKAWKASIRIRSKPPVPWTNEQGKERGCLGPTATQKWAQAWRLTILHMGSTCFPSTKSQEKAKSTSLPIMGTCEPERLTLECELCKHGQKKAKTEKKKIRTYRLIFVKESSSDNREVYYLLSPSMYQVLLYAVHLPNSL